MRQLWSHLLTVIFWCGVDQVLDAEGFRARAEARDLGREACERAHERIAALESANAVLQKRLKLQSTEQTQQPRTTAAATATAIPYESRRDSGSH